MSIETKDKNTESYKSLENYFSKEKLVFYKREQDDIVEYILPYRIQKRNVQVRISVVVSKKTNFCIMSFKKKLNTNIDFCKELLDMNSDLTTGTISVQSNSEYVTYSTTFRLEEDSNIVKIYSYNLFMCLSVLIRLQEKNIVEKENNDEANES